MTRKRIWRRVERAVSGRMGARERTKLLETLRRDDEARAVYERAIEALRALERAPVASSELEFVESRLLADLAPSVASTAPWWRRASSSWSWLGAACAVAAVLALIVFRPPRPPREDPFGVRGSGQGGGLAIDALCPRSSGDGGLVPASEYGCDLSRTLSFAYRVEGATVPRQLSLFAIDEAGDVLYYAPTPADNSAVAAEAGTWQPLSMVVTLDVNHEVGDVVLYGLLSTSAPEIPQLDAVAELLKQRRSSAGRGNAWHRSLKGEPAMSALCPSAESCESAALLFEIYEGPR